MRSEGNGLTWTSAIDSSSFCSMKGVAFEPGPAVGTFTNVGIAVGIGGIWRSTDGGLTWTRLDLPLDFTVLSAAWPAAGVVLAGGDGGALLRNAASTQIAAQQPGPTARVRALATRPAARGAVRPSMSSAPAVAKGRPTSAPSPQGTVAQARTSLDPLREFLR